MRDVAGIFVGGRGTRMGGVAKGLLRLPSGETLVEHWRRLFGELGMTTLLIGRHEAYAAMEWETLDDEAPGTGPLGGLIALLSRAGGGRAVAVACDMPYVSRELLEKLVFHPSEAAIVAPRQGHCWQPLFARYRADRTLEEATRRARNGTFALQGLLDALDAEPLPLSHDEVLELGDWDTMSDTVSSVSRR